MKTSAERVPPRRAEQLALGLAAVRIVSGTLALVAPRVLHRLSGLDPATAPAALAYTRYFGTRALGLGITYLISTQEQRAHLIRLGLLVDGTDTLFAAAMLGRGTLPIGAATWLMAVTGSASAVDIAHIRTIQGRGESTTGAQR